MKEIIKIVDICGPEIHTRIMIEHLSPLLENGNDCLFDFAGVETISRSAADELYNLTRDYHNLSVVNLCPFVQKMLDAVIMGRFQPRQLRPNHTPIIVCRDGESFRRAILQF